MMTRLLFVLMLLLAALPARAADATLDATRSSVVLGDPQGWFGKRWFGQERPRPVTLRLALSQPVPFRLFLLDGPPRLVADFDGADLGDAAPDAVAGAAQLPDLRWGPAGAGRSRVVAELPGPYRIARASQRAGADASSVIVEILLEPVAKKDFAPRPGAAAALRDLPDPVEFLDASLSADAPLRVMLDPGHGGIDPGAQAGGQSEAVLVLAFARELAAALRGENVTVLMTRDDDRFLGLEARLTAARTQAADLFISLHADALPEGQAAGVAIYVWNPAADDRATAQLAARHGRDDLLAGVDLAGTDDALAATLMDVARTDTQPRSENFAKFLASAMALDGIGMHRRPVKGAAFSVLKAPDIPSVLVELGFITDPNDRANLTDPAWRARMVGVMARAITGWAEDEATRRRLLRH